MTNFYWNDWYSGWGWFLWFGVVFLFFSMVGNWGYTYRAHRRFDESNDRRAIDILNARYAQGEIEKSEFFEKKTHILEERQQILDSNINEKVNRSLDEMNPQPIEV
jgi:putative membrane protein